jgi:AraC family transcriptional regulator
MPVKIVKKFPDINAPGFDFKKWDKQFRASNVIINDTRKDVYFPLHWTTFSMKCAFGGKEQYILGNMKYCVDESSYLILNEDTLYESCIDSESSVESFTLNFTKEFLNDVFHSISNCDERLLDSPLETNTSSVNFYEKLYPHKSQLLNFLKGLREIIRSNLTDLQQLDEYFHFILEFLFSEHMNTLTQIKMLDEKKYSTKEEIFRRLNLAKDYMHSNYSEKIELNDLGKISNLAPHYLLRKFKKHFGITPHRYLTLRRLERARDLFLYTDKPITEICSDVGFESLSSFGALFKKHYKLPPGKYKYTAPSI